MKIIDSVGWIEYIGRGPLATAYDVHFERSDCLLTPTIVLYEVQKHVLLQRGLDAALEVWSMMLGTRVKPLTEGIAALAAQQSVEHRLPMADAIIYSTALVFDATVVTSDAHFQGLPQAEYIPKPAD